MTPTLPAISPARCFTVIAHKPAMKRGVSYPARDGLPLDAAQALKLMQRLSSRGFSTVAETTAHGITEQLTIEQLSNCIP